MNRAAEIEASMANIQYELEHDIYNPPVIKDNKPFNMSDYIKPVRVTDENYETEKIASTEVEDEIGLDTDDLLKEYNNLASEILQEQDTEPIEQLAKDDDGKLYTEKILDNNINNFKENLIDSPDIIQGVKNAKQRFIEDNKDVINNVPEVAKDVATYTVSNMIPGDDSTKKAKKIRELIKFELEQRKQQKKTDENKKQTKSKLLGNIFVKQNKTANEFSEQSIEKLAYYKSMIVSRVNKMR